MRAGTTATTIEPAQKRLMSVLVSLSKTSSTPAVASSARRGPVTASTTAIAATATTTVDRLHPQLAPGQPDHSSTSRVGEPVGAGAAGRPVGRGAFHVRQHEVLQAELGDGPRRVEDRGARCGRRGWSAGRCGWRTTTCWSAGSVCVVAAGPGQPVVGGEQRLDLAGEPHLGVDEHDEVVADPLEVGDDVRGEHDAELLLGDGLHQDLEELAPRERVEARDRLVEDEQLGALGQPEGRGRAGRAGRRTAARPAGRGRGRAARSRDRARASSQRGLRWAPSRRWSATLSPAYVGVSWATKPTLASWSGSAAGRPPQHLDRPGRRRAAARRPGSAGCVLPAPFGPTSPATRPAGISQGAVLQRPPAAVALAERRRPRGRRSRYASLRAAKGAPEQRLDALVVEPGGRALASQRSQVASQRLVRGERVVGQRAGDEGADARAGRRPARRARARGRP